VEVGARQEGTEDAAKQWMRGGKPFFPAPSDLRKLTATNAVAPNLIPESAWIEVLEQARKVGYGRRTVFHNGESVLLPGPVFSHPLIEKAVESVGWKNICHSDEPTIVRAQFLKTLNNLIDAEVERVADRRPSRCDRHQRFVGRFSRGHRTE